MAHTPAPWACENVPDREGAIGVFNIKGASYRVASVPLRLTPDEREANARLIAAAPDLLAALKDLLALYEHANDLDRMRAKFDAARSAIARAERT